MIMEREIAVLTERLEALAEKLEDGFRAMEKKLDGVCAFQNNCTIKSVEERVRWHDKLILMAIGAQFTIMAGLIVLIFQVFAGGKP